MPVNIGVNIQRSPNRINQQLREAGVEGKFPKLLLDFKDQYYLASGGSKTLANAVTHARSGNATMTDGYGPELVVNGDFSSGDLTGWTDNSTGSGSVSVVNNTLLLAGTDTSNRGFVTSDSFTTKPNVAYVIELSVTDRQGSGDLQLQFSDVGGNRLDEFPITAKGRYQYTVIAQRTASYLKINCYDDDSVSIDNVSVREMPVLKWAPHNRMVYSETFATGWSEIDFATLTPNAIAAPDGTQTASLLTADSSGTGGPRYFSSQVQDITANQQQTFACFFKAGTATYSFVTIRHSASNAASVQFNLSTGAVATTRDDGNMTINASNITDVGNGWFLCSVTATCTASTSSGLYMLGLGDGSALIGGGYPSITLTGQTIYAWGAHLYRSDLGGMVDNPDRGDSYVPTTSAAKYLPRVGHHVYNGSAWVNEGLLAESEARVNQLTYSNDFSNSDYNKGNTAVDADDAVSPDGTENASLFKQNSTSDTQFRIWQTVSLDDSSDYTFSVYLKKKDEDYAWLELRPKSSSPNAYKAWFDLVDGTVGTINDSAATANIQEVGNGWYRCSISAPSGTGSNAELVLIGMAEADFDETLTGVVGEGMYIYGAQLEKGPTPSSYIPTISSTTRAAETFTIPSANLPWPSPNYIGSELVTNGTFDTDSDWTKGTGWSILGGVASSDGTQTGNSLLSQSSIIQSGKIYSLSIDVTRTNGAVWVSFVGNSNVTGFINTTKTVDVVFVASQDSGINVTCNSAFIGSVDNISVREIDPLSVSIAMDGRMTYADEDGLTAEMFRWQADTSNTLRHLLYTTGAETGEINLFQINGGSSINTSHPTDYLPNVLTPINYATVNTSTALNIGKDGVAATRGTLSIGLPDLSSSDARIAYDYMGTIDNVRIWDRDITDDGLVEATNPSLEPSLSLTFEGTGTNSFVVNDWSE